MSKWVFDTTAISEMLLVVLKCLDTCSVPRQGNSTLKGFDVMMHNTEKESERCVEVERKNTENEGFWGEEPYSFLFLSEGKM